jgi:hypothetical protein
MHRFARARCVWTGWMVLAMAAGCSSVKHRDDPDGGDVDAAPLPDGPVPEVDGAPLDSGPTAWFVNAATGDDVANDGKSAATPFLTITRALAAATSGEDVLVAAGTYDASLGETFPITIPDGVILRGDEDNKGAGVIVAGGSPSEFIGTVIAAGSGSVVAGLTISAVPSGADNTMGLDITVSNVTVQNCTITDGAANAIYIRNGSTGHVIRGNVLLRNNEGIGFIGGGEGSLVEGNLIRDNVFGVEYDSAGGDLGGGNAGSTGGNIIACNTSNDLWSNQAITITAIGCAWDHAPPSGNDVFNGGGATIDLSDATVALDPCL